MPVFDAAATRALLPAAALVEAVIQAMRARRAGSLNAPERLALPLPAEGSYLVMPAADAELAITKLVTVHPHNSGCGLPTIQGLVLVTDAGNGQPLMLLDGPTLTARRTAAVTALGLRVLSRQPLRSVALVGTGAQALEHARLLAELGGLERVEVVGRDQARVAAFVDAVVLSCPGVRLRAAVSIDEALSRVDAVVTLTTATRPVLPDGLRDELLVVGVGAFQPHMAELPPSLLRLRAVVVDALPGARHEAGDLIQAGIDWGSVTELVDHLDVSGAPGPAPVFKTVGQAAWDLAAAHVAVNQARSGGCF
ncbi:MAG: delta(1)-pyrroline-2-carboxylate reductase family protein [Methylibium sp.]|nr:delta(1)-pyrroline-2-carboxylate reductase family protein [Methylibium sp.]